MIRSDNRLHRKKFYFSSHLFFEYDGDLSRSDFFPAISELKIRESETSSFRVHLKSGSWISFFC